MNLVPAIREINSQIAEIRQKHVQELEPYINSLAALLKINTACEHCGGAGKVMRPRSCAEDDRKREYILCKACNGDGKSASEREAKG